MEHIYRVKYDTVIGEPIADSDGKMAVMLPNGDVIKCNTETFNLLFNMLNITKELRK